MRCIDATHEGQARMTLQTPAISPAVPSPVTQTGDGRRLLALPGIAAIIGALITAAVSFAVLLGLTPLDPD